MDIENINKEIEEQDIDITTSEDEMYEHVSLVVDKGQSLIRIDKFLTNRLEGRSRNRIQSASDAGCLLVNGTAVKSSYKVKPLDKISVVLPYPLQKFELVPEDIPLNIVYEDDDIIIVNKEAGMVVHPGFGNFTGTLVNALTYHLKDLPLFQSGDMRAGLVHRIDKDTSGLLVVAKNEYSHTHLARQFFDHTIDRVYNALVWGNMENDHDTIIGNIGRNVKDRLVMTVFADGSEGKHAITHYKTLERFGYVSLIECKLETGRTHQIRAHMRYIGHPLFNDARYGGDQILRGTTFTKYKQFINNCFSIMPRQGLHAKTLGFIHPKTKEHMIFESELATDMAQVLDKWRTYIDRREE